MFCSPLTVGHLSRAQHQIQILKTIPQERRWQFMTDVTHDHASSTGISNVKLGMWAFLGSECLLFGGLISTYMLYRGRVTGGPRPSQIFDIPFTSVSSFILLMSSLTMVLAVSAAHKEDDRKINLWLTVTALLGATFVGGHRGCGVVVCCSARCQNCI